MCNFSHNMFCRTLFVLVVSMCIVATRGMKSRRRFYENDKDDSSNETPTARIIGGSYAPTGKFPYMVSFQQDGLHFCGGTIIHPRWIITAAHCFMDDEDYFNGTVALVGTNSLSSGGQRYRIDGIVCHERYNQQTYANDICLVRTEKSIQFNQFVQRIKLASHPFTDGSVMTAVGWGVEKTSGELSDALKLLQVKTISPWICRKRIQLDIPSTLLCVLSIKDEGTCSGDSGGPLVYNQQLVGITIWGLNCANGYPNTSTKVYLFIHWIQEKIEKFTNF